MTGGRALSRRHAVSLALEADRLSQVLRAELADIARRETLLTDRPAKGFLEDGAYGLAADALRSDRVEVVRRLAPGLASARPARSGTCTRGSTRRRGGISCASCSGRCGWEGKASRASR